MSYGGNSGSGNSIATSTDAALNNPADAQVLTYDGTLAKWKNATAPSALVSSVANKTGAVVLAENDITGLVADLAARAPLASPGFTGTPTVGGSAVATAEDLNDYVTTSAVGAASGPAKLDTNGHLSLAQMPGGTVFYVKGSAASGWTFSGSTITFRPTARTDLMMIVLTPDSAGPSWALTDDIVLSAPTS